YVISMEDVEASLRNLKVSVEKLLADLTVYIQNFAGMVKDIFASGTLPDTLIQKTQQLLNAINEEYDIKAIVIYVIDTMREMIQQIDLEKLKGSSISFLHDIDAKYEIVAKLQTIMTELKETIETVDMQAFAAELKRYILSINFKAHIEELLSQIPTEMFSDITNYIEEFIQDFDILRKINTFYAKIRELIVKFEADRKVQAALEKVVELIKKFRIEETISVFAEMVKDIPTTFMQVFDSAIIYLKTTDVKDIIQGLKMCIEIVVQTLNSLDYNSFVENANQIIAWYTVYVNELIRALEIPQKVEATIDFINHVLSLGRVFMEHLREIKVAQSVTVVFDNLKEFAEFIKQKITNFDAKAEITSYLAFVSKYYTRVITIITDTFTNVFEMIKKVAPEQKIISEIQQIIFGLTAELRKAELNTPSFIIPFTDLVVPSMKFCMDKLEQFEIPTQLDIPEFTILSFHTVKATTISFDDIKQRIIEVINFFINFGNKMRDVDAIFEDLTLNYFPSMPEITLPEITLPEVSFPTIPQVPAEKLVKSLQVPKIKLPTIPSEIMVPCFGKLYGEIKFHSPIYTVKTSAEFQNSTQDEINPIFTGVLNSEATSSSFEILNYKLDSTARIAIPKMSRVVFAETLKFNHLALGVEHQASVTLYGPSAMAQVKTTIKVTTTPYRADFTKIAFIGIEEGMSASLDTAYTHVLDLPSVDVKSEVTLTQKATVRQDGFTLTLAADHSATGKFNDDDGNHKSNLKMSLSPSTFTLTCSGDTDSTILKMKQHITAESGTFSYIKFNVRNEAESSVIKNSTFVASGQGNLYDLKVELKATHHTELSGTVTGVLSNELNLVARPFEFLFEFQNKGNAKVNIFNELSAKIDLQNDYSAIFKPDSQQLNTLALARLNQYKMFYNFTVDNNENEAGIFVDMESEANLDFLTFPISIPEIDLPFVDIRTPAISDLNLYEQTGLNNILTTTEQTVDVDAKVVYQKSQAGPVVDMMGLIQIPPVGNLITELSFKSAIINLNVNAGLYAEDDLVFRLGASTASVFEGLKAKLDGTTSLTTKRGIKLANSLSLENRHIEGTHNSTVSLSTETFESAVSVATFAKIALPILNLEANQNLVADTKSKLNAVSTLKMTGDINIPVIKAVGKAETDQSLKLEGTLDYVSLESSTKANMDGTVLDDYLVLGVLDNDVNLYLNNNGLRSTSKMIADAKVNHGTTKIIGLDVNENLAVEASLSRVYAVLKYTSNNEANFFNFNTNGKHIAQAAIDIAPTFSFTADVEIDISQPSSLGDFTIYKKAAAEVTAAKQKFSNNVKFVSPLYTTNLAAEAEGIAPVFTFTSKSSATSVIVLLEYDMDASFTANFENEAVNMITKVDLTHADLSLDVNHVITQALRRKRQADDSASRHTLNVDITSPTFTDVNLRYAARRDAISASVSTPSSGFLGLQFSGKVPSQMIARVYGRYPSAPEVDVDILVIRSSSKDADKMNLQIAYNMEAPKEMLYELKTRLPSIISTVTMFADKYQITRNMEELKNTFVNHISEAYDAAINYDARLTELSIFFRNIIVQYQKTVQVFLDAVIKGLRETQFKLPNSDEMTTLPEVLKKLTSSIAAVLEMTLQRIYENTEVYYNSFLENINSVKLNMPVGDAITVGQILDQVKTAFKKIFDELVDFVKNMESLDTMLVKMGETLKAVVEKSQEFVDSVNSDYLDAVFININELYRKLITVTKNVVEQISALNMEQLSNAYEFIIDMFIQIVDQFNITVHGLLQQASEEAQAYMKVSDGRLEIDLPFPFQQ
ncbi:apolipoprotein B-100-like, partial [Micropterus dolomieu]|uniref:apolipoprotein B-100-like n=1 Tax=Micropterus dolomieu TaxID=147949 RepID=UPI001E8D9196